MVSACYMYSRYVHTYIHTHVHIYMYILTYTPAIPRVNKQGGPQSALGRSGDMLPWEVLCV